MAPKNLSRLTRAHEVTKRDFAEERDTLCSALKEVAVVLEKVHYNRQVIRFCKIFYSVKCVLQLVSQGHSKTSCVM